MIRELEVLLADVLVQLFIVGSSEWELTAKQGIKEHSEGPDISWWTRVLDLAYDLRCHIGWCSTEYLHLPIMWDAS